MASHVDDDYAVCIASLPRKLLTMSRLVDDDTRRFMLKLVVHYGSVQAEDRGLARFWLDD